MSKVRGEALGGKRWLNVAHNTPPEQANEVTVYDPLQLCHRLNCNKMPERTQNHWNIRSHRHTQTLSYSSTVKSFLLKDDNVFHIIVDVYREDSLF